MAHLASHVIMPLYMKQLWPVNVNNDPFSVFNSAIMAQGDPA